MPGRQGDRELLGRASIELGWTAGSRAGATGAPLELHVEQTVLGQPVEVELRSVHGDADRLSSLLAPHRPAAGDDEVVEGAPHRLGERADALNGRREVGHEPS